MSTRERLLHDLIKLRRPLFEVASELASYSWDSKEELVQLTSADVVGALRKYISGEIPSEEIERWANLIECRDDINYEGFSDLLFRLSSPEINGKLTTSSANEIVVSIDG